MPERPGLKQLADELRSAFHRLIAGISVVDVDLLPQLRSLSVDAALSVKTGVIPVGIISRSGSVGFAFNTRLVAFPGVKTVTRRLESAITASVQSLPIGNARMVKLNQPDFTVRMIKSYPVEIAIKNRAIGIEDAVGFAKPKICDSLANLRTVPAVRSIGVGDRPGTKKNLEIITRQPITIRPTPWEQVEKLFIIKSWEMLRSRVKEQLGHDPGKDLEMTAIFRGIDFTNIKRTVYEQKNRELKLYLHASTSGKAMRTHGYAIIVGLVKGTGRVVQITMPEET